jgi:hypothetical protein
MMQKYDNINMYHMMSIASSQHGGQQLVFRTIMLSLVLVFFFSSNWIQFKFLSKFNQGLIKL